MMSKFNFGTDSHQSAKSASGPASNISGHGNVAQTVSVEAPKSNKLIGVVIPLLAALLGAYANHAFTVMRASEETVNGTQTLLGIAKGAIELAQTNNASPELLKQLAALVSQAQAVQSSAKALQQPSGTASLQADFWLGLGKGAQLPKGGTIGLNRVFGPGDIAISFNEGGGRVSSGKKLSYRSKDGTNCYVVYLGPGPDTILHGFKTWCDN